MEKTMPMAATIASILLFLGCFASVCTGTLLTADDAVHFALKNNYDIRVARNEAEIARINNTAGNAGMLPSISVIGSDNFAIVDSRQKSTAGTETQSAGARVGTSNAAVALSWTVFDGFRMFITKKKLGELASLGTLRLKTDVLQTVFAVTAAYYDVVRQKQQLASLKEAIVYNAELVNILQTSFNAGLSQKANLLQAQIDLNVYREREIGQNADIASAKRALNHLMGRDPGIDFEVADSIPLTYKPDRNQATKKLFGKNPAVLSYTTRVEVSKLGLREIGTQRWPKLTLNAGATFLQIDNSADNPLMSRKYGPLIGATLTLPLYQGGAVSRQTATAKLELQTAEFNLQNEKIRICAHLQNALDEFENGERLLRIETETGALAKENLDIAMQRIRLGQSTVLEIRQAQESFVGSMTRLAAYRHNLKVAETKVRQLIDEL